MIDLRTAAKKPLSLRRKARKTLARAERKLKSPKLSNDPLAAFRAQALHTEAKMHLDAIEKKHGELFAELSLAEALYEKQLDQRAQYRLAPKGQMKPDGSRRYLVPDTSKLLLAKPHPFQGKTVTITADITAPNNPGGLKDEQYLQYGTTSWRTAYGLRNTVESANRSLKRAQFGDIQNADRRQVRGNTFTYVVAAFAAVCKNIRKILDFLKEKLSLRPVTPKNAEVPTLYWDPTIVTDETDPPRRS